MFTKKPYKHMPNIVFGNYMLRTIKISDYRDLYDYGKDVEVTRYLNWGPMVLPTEAKETIRQVFYPRLKDRLPRGYAIIDLKKNKMIGTVDYHDIIEGTRIVEMGFALNRAYWNKGIMTQAVKELIKIGFDYLNYDKIIIKHLQLNFASQKVIEKAGFKYVKKEAYTLRKRDSVIRNDLLIYEMTKEDYNGN